MNLLPDADQQQIIDALVAFLDAEAPVERLRRHGPVGNPDAALWAPLGELGFVGLGLSEEAGGAGLGPAEEMLAFREYGRRLVSPEILGLVMGAHLAAAANDLGLARALASGAKRVGLANPRPSAGPGAVHLIEAQTCDLVLALSQAEAALYPTDAFTNGTGAAPMDSSVSLIRADRTGSGVLSLNDPVPLYLRSLLLVAAYTVGLAEATRDMATEYAKIREQFGKPIGAFQAVKHRCAEMAMRAEAAHCQAAFAALVFGEAREDSAFQVTAAKIVGSDAALKNAASNIQVHGAFGFTAEADAHHFLKRSHLLDLLWGDMRSHKAAMLALSPAA